MRWWPYLAAFIALILAVPIYRAVTQGDASPEIEPGSTSSLDGDSPPTQAPNGAADEAGLAAIGSIVADPGAPTRSAWMRQKLGPVYVALRHDGVVIGSGWASGDVVEEALRGATEEARSGLEQEPEVGEVCVSHSFRSVEPGDSWLDAIHAGVLGVEVTGPSGTARYSPTLMVGNNWDAGDVLERYAAGASRDLESVRSSAELSVFGCDQFLVDLTVQVPKARPMFRGNEVIEPEAVTSDSVERLAEGMGDWLTRSLHPDGRMTYKYWPSARRESDANNMIRQWMASVALVRWGEHRNDPTILDAARRNIRHNLDRFYREEDGLGIIEYEGKVKLGALALAALAIVEHPDRQEFANQEASLRRTIQHLWNDDGSFDTFLLPEGRNDNQNFYPGEALVLWSHLLALEPDDVQLADRFAKSFAYYREWHLDEENRNPAFVPWHTQAYFARWTQTRDLELRDFVFEMNDWLLDMQQWEDAPYPDVRGRFYDPERPGFGPPHASATGVYLEGLADAHALAEAVGDEDRARRYAEAIRRGLRGVMQLQFVDEIDLYYVAEPDRARGGIRTTVYDNEIRVDNVQHNLLAALKVLRGAQAPLADN